MNETCHACIVKYHTDVCVGYILLLVSTGADTKNYQIKFLNEKGRQESAENNDIYV